MSSTVRRIVNKENGGDSSNHVTVQMGSDVGDHTSNGIKHSSARRSAVPRQSTGAGSRRRGGTIRRKRQRQAQQYACYGILGGFVLGSFILISRFRSRSVTNNSSGPVGQSNKNHYEGYQSEGAVHSTEGLGPYMGSGYQRPNVQESYDSQIEKQKFRFSNPLHLPLLPSRANGIDPIEEAMEHGIFRQRKKDFQVRLAETVQPWENESEAEDNLFQRSEPFLDYTKHEYEYSKLMDSPTDVPEGDYPFLQPLGELFDEWPQDDLDHPPTPIKEHLMVFDYMDPKQREAALRFRNAELPFKVYNVPEIDAVSEKWTDAYVSHEFDSRPRELDHNPSQGTCQQSDNNYFAFFNNKRWSVNTLGPPPTMDTDFSFALWSKHARYADKVGLPPDAIHYYWQAGAAANERKAPKEKWSMISRDLPTFQSLEPNFFSFNPREQKGVQCRFGERGVTAATHYDTGRNMIAMITGAKRYILSPPVACSKLGIVTNRKHPSFRHSMLNFAHIHLLSEKYQHLAGDMPEEEREWLKIARDAPSLSTVLKQGEVLYVPSHWFHYITSLQKSAQCNVRSGIEITGTKAFGGLKTVQQCMGDSASQND